MFEQDEITRLVPYIPRWPLYWHMVNAVFQMGASAYYHNYFQMNKQALKLIRVDLAGIAFMIMGSVTPAMYYGMMCEDSKFYRNLWLGQVYLCCFIALAVTLSEEYLKLSHG